MRPMGLYDEWSRVIRGALIWAGQPDVAGTQDDLRDCANEERTDASTLLRAWYAYFGEAPTTLATEEDYREFVTTVIYHPHLARLPEPSLKQAFIDRVTELASKEPVPFTLDYWRLNMAARKP